MADVLQELDKDLVPRRGPAKIRYTHDAMIDLILQNPGVSQNELALAFGYTAGWVSQIIASDAFQARLAMRKDELVDPTIRATVEERFKALVVRSLELLQEKLNGPATTVSDSLVLKGLELSSKALGYGARDSQPSHPVNPNHLNQLAERLVQLQGNIRERNCIDAEAEDVTPKGGQESQRPKPDAGRSD